jgi:kynureninase
MPSFHDSAEYAAAADEADELAPLRREFHVPESAAGPVHYLCGHSLGLMPRLARQCVERELDRWAASAVEGHFDEPGGWLGFHERFSAPLATLAGARADEVVAMNTLSVNLHLMMASFFRPTRKRFKVLIERGAFPSDRYAVRSQLAWHGLDSRDALIEFGPEPDSGLLDADRFAEFLATEGERIALVLLPGVQYLSGQVLDLERYTASAHAHGCRIGFDLAHAIGNVPLQLHRWGADFAVWCSYKYLNAGPGAIGGCFVHERWAADERLPRLAGWWGHEKTTRFAMPEGFVPERGAEGWQLSNPPILSLAPLAASLDIFGRAGLRRLHEKSARLTGYLRYLLARRLGERASILTPAELGAHGNQLSVRLAAAAGAGERLTRALRELGVVVDWRQPDILRAAPAPLYNGFGDVYRAACALAQILA